jgi:hypothetical protein
MVRRETRNQANQSPLETARKGWAEVSTGARLAQRVRFHSYRAGMSNNTNKPEQVEQRSLGTTLATAAVAGAASGAAGVVTKQLLEKAKGGDKKPK